jgi:SAM-dependent methyltransferase
MAERKGGWSAALSVPLAYDLVHHAIGARRWMKRFVADIVQPQSGERMLDVGCGTAGIVPYLPDVDYCGFDRDARYIESARRRFGARARFFCDDVGTIRAHGVGPFNVATAIGLLHHLNDDAALDLLAKVREALVPGGRLITADPCFFEGQPWITRLVVANDRGTNVRHFDQYLALAQKVFPQATATLEAALLPFPHAVCEIVCRKEYR